MQLKNTPNSFGWLAKTFHWTLALLIIALWCVGTLMEDMENTPQKFEIYMLHKSFGLIVLIVGVCAFTWRALNVKPQLNDIDRFQKLAASASKYVLYACMLIMPLSGWAMNSASGRPLTWFNTIPLPGIVAPNPELAGLFRDMHGVTAWLLLATFIAHAGAALLHHFYYKDNVLRRMLP